MPFWYTSSPNRLATPHGLWTAESVCGSKRFERNDGYVAAGQDIYALDIAGRADPPG